MTRINNQKLDELSKNHYTYLCSAFSFSVIKRLEESISKYKSKRKKIFKDYLILLNYLNKNIENILIGKPIELEKHKEYLFSKCSQFEFTNKNKSIEQKEIWNNLTFIFNYATFSSNGFTKKELFYSGNTLVDSLGLTNCPYCNRNTIFSIESNRTCELDHFYPQSKYPYFALSFYNLIPSCKVCNKIKLAKDDKKYINPYDKRFDMNKNMKFTLKIKNSSFIFSEDGFDLKYKFGTNVTRDEKRRIVNNRKDFKLKDLYKNHKDIVLELIQKREIYPDSYIDDLFHQYEGTLFKNREDVLRHITGGYIEDKDINKRPLSKLIKDISEELDLI